MEEVKRLTDSLLHSLEEDRRRIARDLHDGMGQRLAALRLQLERVQKVSPRPELQDALRSCEELRAEMHRVIYDLQPPELESSSLADILRDQSEQFELRTGITTSFRASGEDIRDPDAASALLRILQESLTNSARHGQATEVGIVLVTFSGTATLEVTDDGKGFDPSNALMGHGLRSMRERVQFLGGSVEVKSKPGEGASVCVRVPIRQEER
ncbi:MAG: sensor histidine kinase [Myxococcaceae bacterium]